MIVLQSNQNNAEAIDTEICFCLVASMGMGGGYVPMIVQAYGVTTKGNGDAFINKETHTALSLGGGQAGQGYPCVLEVKDDIHDKSGNADSLRKSLVHRDMQYHNEPGNGR